MIALSTAWHPRNVRQLDATLEAIARMGFGAAEIGIADSVAFDLKRAQRAVRSTGLQVVSLHNVCSVRKLEPANRRGDWLASADEAQRRIGVEATLDSIENAKALGASTVVLHIGSLPVEERWEKQSLLDKLRRGAEVEAGVTRDAILAQRPPLVPVQFEAACRSLEDLLERSSGIRLGIESRLGWHELPSLSELGELLRRFPDPRVGYWHDVGHAVIQGFLGLADPYDWLRVARGRTFGAHLHDVRWGSRDHYPPGLGEVDFEPILDLLPPEALLVMEISASFIAEEIVLGRRRLEEVRACS